MKSVKNLKYNNPLLDDPETTIQRRILLKKKFFLRKIYEDFYNKIFQLLTDENRKGVIVEIGSGGGFIKEIYPNITTSDIMKLPDVDMQFSALEMPFKKDCVSAFVMIDVLHHINNAEGFFKEADRCLRPNGQIIMIEPSSNFFSRIIWENFHHEPHDREAKWKFKSFGPLSSANSALPWIIFFRDKQIFEQKFKKFNIMKIEAHTPLKYILSGGFTLSQMVPDFLYAIIDFIELLLKPLSKYTGLFYSIVIIKRQRSC